MATSQDVPTTDGMLQALRWLKDEISNEIDAKVALMSGTVIAPSTPQTINGALWEDSLSNGDLCLKMRYGDYEFNFKYDTITYKGDNTGLVSYLPLQQSTADAIGNTVAATTATPVIEAFTIDGMTYRGLRNVDGANPGSQAIASTDTNRLCDVTLPNSLSIWTVDAWFNILSSNAVDNTYALFLAVQGGNNSFRYVVSGGKIMFGSITVTGCSSGRYHLAVTCDGSKQRVWINGTLAGEVSDPKILQGVGLWHDYYGTGASAYLYLDHVRVWNKVVWDSPFEVPKMSDY